MLNHSIFGYFDQCRLINETLSEYGFFFRFYERNKFRYQLKQNLKEKNKMKRELSSCVIQKFNGYELIRNNLNVLEKKDFIPIDIVYEPTLDENKKIECFFAPDITLAYVGYIEKLRKNEKYMESRITRQCHCYSNFFVKSDKKIKEHLACCSGKAEFTFSYDQSYNSLMSLAHFFVLDFNFFNDPEIYKKNTLKQPEAAALSVKQKEKNTTLAEMFSIELKFPVNCLKAWFQKNHKILEVHIDQKLEFIRKNPIKMLFAVFVIFQLTIELKMDG